MPTAETAFIVKIREQIKMLRDADSNYVSLGGYVSDIAEAWEFEPDDEFEFVGDELLVVRDGPTNEQGNEGVPEYVFPLRHVVATVLLVSEE